LISGLILAALVLATVPLLPRMAIAATACTVTYAADGRPVVNPTAPGPGTGKKVGFDNTHAETAGQADWVIDGGFSDFACALAGQGFAVEEIRTYPLTTAVLNTYDVVVFGEANTPFTGAEELALQGYVAGGKGLLLVGDHYQSDRNLNTWDSTEVYNGFRRGHYGQTFTSPSYNYNGLKTTSTYTFNSGTDWLAGAFGFRFRFNAMDLSGGPFYAGSATDTADPGILPPEKTFGITTNVGAVSTYAGSTLSIVDPTRAMGIVYPNKNSITRWSSAQSNDPVALYTDNVGTPAGGTATYGGINEGAFVAIAKPSAGKVAAIGDSSTWEDITPKYKKETDGTTKSTHDGFNERSDHAALAVNIVNWLAAYDPTVGIDPALRQTVTPEPYDSFTISEPIVEPWSQPPTGYLWYDACTFKTGAYNGNVTGCTAPPVAGWNVNYTPANVYPGNKVATYLNAAGLTAGTSYSTQFYWYVNGSGLQMSRRYNRTTGTWDTALNSVSLTADSQGNLQRWEFWDFDAAAANRNLNLRLKVGGSTKYTSGLVNQAANGTYGYLTVEQGLGFSDGTHAALFTAGSTLDTAVAILKNADTTITLPAGTYALEIRNDTTVKQTGVTVTITAGQTASLTAILNPKLAGTWKVDSVSANIYPGNRMAAMLNVTGLTPGATYSTQAYEYVTGVGTQVADRYNRTTGAFEQALTAQDLKADAGGTIRRLEFWNVAGATANRGLSVRLKADGATKQTTNFNQVNTGNFGYLTIESALGFNDGLHAAVFMKSGTLDTAVGIPQGADATVTLPEGAYTLEIWNDGGTDLAGVTFTVVAGKTSSLFILLDKTPPTINAGSAPAPNANGWNNGDVTVTFTCTDNESGIASCTEPVTLSNDGADQSVTGTAVDQNGNTATASVSHINIDKTAPVVTFQGDREYGADETVNLACTAADSLSGVTGQPCAGALANGPAYTFGVGTHQVTVTATDKAGNTTTATAGFTVKASFDSLMALTGRFIKQNGIAISLNAKVKAAREAEGRGDTNARDGALNAFRNEAAALAGGKFLTATDAKVLDTLAAALMN
jgi:hypothetical protein